MDSGTLTYKAHVASRRFGRRAGGAGGGVSGSAARGVGGGVVGTVDRGGMTWPTARPAGR